MPFPQHGNAAVLGGVVNYDYLIADITYGLKNRFEAALKKIPGVPVDDDD